MTTPPIPQDDFTEITQLIAAARQRAVQEVNTALIELYWQVGQTISRKIEQAEWGDGVVAQLAAHLAKTQPGLRGFTSRNLFRMRQFFETYRDEKLVAAVLTQLPWTHHLIILSQSKRPEEREFYLRQAIREKWSSRELERQFKTALFERTVLHPVKLSPAWRKFTLTRSASSKTAIWSNFLACRKRMPKQIYTGACCCGSRIF